MSEEIKDIEKDKIFYGKEEGKEKGKGKKKKKGKRGRPKKNINEQERNDLFIIW